MELVGQNVVGEPFRLVADDRLGEDAHKRGVITAVSEDGRPSRGPVERVIDFARCRDTSRSAHESRS